MNIQDYNNKAKELNEKYPAVKAVVSVSKWGGRLEIEVSSVNKARSLQEMFPKFVFTSGCYK